MLALLRGLVPRRPLTHHEALRIAELQANRLLEHFAVTGERRPGRDHHRAASHPGRARTWPAGLRRRPLERPLLGHHPQRRRAPAAPTLQPDARVQAHRRSHRQGLPLHGPADQTAHEQAERVADYFAACLLMPKRVVKRLWGEGHQDIGNLAEMLRVSPAALRYRLDQLGLTEQRARCDRPTHPYPTPALSQARSLRPALTGGSR